MFFRFFLEREERGWSAYCLVSAVLLLLVFLDGINSPVLMARTLRLATLIGWMAASVIAIKLLSFEPSSQPITKED